MYIHCGDEDVVTQARGRYRGNLDYLYVYRQDLSSIVIPDDYLDIPLFAEDKKCLSHELNILNADGRLCMWPTIKAMLPGSGYQVSELRKKGKRVSVISKSDASR